MSAQVTSDYVIVGAGSAGCALAYRLAEAGHSVSVIEFGGSDRGPLPRDCAAPVPMENRSVNSQKAIWVASQCGFM